MSRRKRYQLPFWHAGRNLGFALFLFWRSVTAAAPSATFNRYHCLRDLMPITERGVFINQRKGVEDPFVVNNRHLVFPEVESGEVIGFYVYDETGAWHYDAVESKDGKQLIKDLKFDSSQGILELVAQPKGLETFSMTYLPGFNPKEPDQGGSVMLGSSVLPVVGAMISRPLPPKNAFNNPATAYESDLRRWMSKHSSGRFPADDKKAEIKKTMRRLSLSGRGDAWAPLDNELKLRQQWIRTHNLDEQAFRSFTRIMDGSCKRQGQVQSSSQK
ncbi:MAG: hypothetical protein KF799_10600 [Bdellovibrionales bacterium]|nr:hypothetical protein [Bdellovibrionales bacterium]